MKKNLVLIAVGLILIAAAFIATNNVSKHNAYTTSAAPVSQVIAPVETPKPVTSRALTAKEQAFVDQACADSVNQSMYNTCKDAFIKQWDNP